MKKSPWSQSAQNISPNIDPLWNFTIRKCLWFMGCMRNKDTIETENHANKIFLSIFLHATVCLQSDKRASKMPITRRTNTCLDLDGLIFLGKMKGSQIRLIRKYGVLKTKNNVFCLFLLIIIFWSVCRVCNMELK